MKGKVVDCLEKAILSKNFFQLRSSNEQHESPKKEWNHKSEYSSKKLFESESFKGGLYKR